MNLPLEFIDKYLDILERNKQLQNEAWEDYKTKLVPILNMGPNKLPPLALEAILQICHNCFITAYAKGGYNTSKGLLNDLGLGGLVELVESSASASTSSIPKTTINPTSN